MTRSVNCSLLKKQATGFEQPPYPGEIGQRIYEQISTEAWQLWLERSVMIINEYQLNSADLKNQQLLEQHMLGFLFGEGEYGAAPQGFSPVDEQGN